MTRSVGDTNQKSKPFTQLFSWIKTSHDNTSYLLDYVHFVNLIIIHKSSLNHLNSINYY